MLALALADQNRLEDATVAAEAARSRDRRSRDWLNLGASIALRRGLPAEAERLSRTALDFDPFDQRALSDLILALRQRGVMDEADRLGDARRLAVLSTPASPAGFGAPETFNAALADAIVSHPDLQRPQRVAAMAGGLRLRDVFGLTPQLASALRAMALDAADAWSGVTDLDDDHPARAGRPLRLRLEGWANVVGPGDFEHPHIHEAGWLSGVYYAHMPPSGGAIRLGGHHHAALPFAEPSHSLTPQAGQLLLFPSYLHHSTEPFAGPGSRISIAFDLMAAA